MEPGAEHPGTGSLTAPRPRRLVGIDLGTTNSAVAWMDAAAAPTRTRPRLFAIPQLVAPGEVAARPTLPSFLYFPTDDERRAGALALPWELQPEAVAGVFARDHGALVPARQVSSAKSWLSNAAVDRRAALLPWASDGGPKLSPVDASARLLAHIRDAWNHAHAADALLLQEQDVVLTVPASFDEEARELTVEAAQQAGLARLTLLEEPLAALYAWIATHRTALARRFAGGCLVLVCDVGGGTTDFSLIRASDQEGEIRFERLAIGDHLLLGGDNLDLALAALAERRLTEGTAGGRIGLSERQTLRRLCSAAKERLLADDAPEEVAVTLLGSGRGVVGGAATVVLTRADVRAALDDFLPVVPRGATPERQLRRGLRELGLPYESDPAITRHLAAFLTRAARVLLRDQDAADAPGPNAGAAGLVQPDAVLFNGGFFTPALARARVLDTLEAWFGTRPDTLSNDAPDAAVALGAAFHAAIRRDPAASGRLLIRAGSARSYYVAVQADGAADAVTAVCVLPRGIQEGAEVLLQREFTVVANQPAAFTLLSTADRADPADAVVTFGGGDDVHRHAPLVTAFRYGQRSRRVPLQVGLRVRFTDVGTLELWCESKTTDHRWRLQFNLRGRDAATGDASGEALDDEEAAPDRVVIGDDAVAAAERLIRGAFGPAAAPSADSLMGELENALGHGKQAWPLPVIRRLADVLLEVADGRRRSARHEARWLNLAGFCMRPGFGTPVDPWRVGEARKVYTSGVAFPKDIQCQVEWLILWQRVAAGFTTAQQQELANRLIGLLGLGTRKAPRLNTQMLREAWRLLAGLERLDRMQRVRLGDDLAARIGRDPQNTSFLWALGRFGARVPLYGPLSSVVPPNAAERWLQTLRAHAAPPGDALAAAVQIAARTDDPVRDIGDDARAAAIAWLEASGAPADSIRPVREVVAVDPTTSARQFGEALPEGLRLVSGSG